ncbi:DNA-3-methyladenine glycosylase [Paralcaligenes sp. KSB-10]|jgi:DNA-3-methyladenine glycosylase|uniref:DNA-3-methyladenine glycosylase n=1 Tax=Paralcaligenes sp. KSB-10 TaxID=2901142 RepID=UPI00210358F9|nr:DNA-3-methyladenine glycosylase [Paralcaligenes sp. KSB-10]
MQKLSRNFYNRDTCLVARELLGKLLVRHVQGEERIARIVEVEAYLGPHDLAAHTSKGITPRTRVMYGPPGHVYVYLVYGMHHCMNVVTEADGTGAAVLLRALEPIQNVTGKTSGPGLLCKAMGVTLQDYGHDLCSKDFYIASPTPGKPMAIVERPRIGVDYAGEWASKPLRFYIEGNKFISKK